MNQQLGFPSPTETKPPVNSSPSIKELSTLVQGMIQNQHMQSQMNNVVVDRLLALEGQVQKPETQIEALKKRVQLLQTRVETLIATGGLGRQTSVYLGDNLILTRVLGRFKMFVDTTDLSSACHLIADGYWEMGTTKFLESLLKPGMTVVDIGARFGYYSLIAAAAVGPDGRVHAIEADPRNFEILQKNVDINGFGSAFTQTIHTHRITLLDAKGLSALIAGPVALVRIAAEVSTLQILEAAHELVAHNPKLNMLVGFRPPLLERAGIRPSDFLRRIKELGFSFYPITDQGTLDPQHDTKTPPSALSATLLLKRG